MNSFYAMVKQHLLGGDIDLDEGTILVQLVGSGYTADLNNHETLEDLDDLIEGPVEITDKSIVGGVFDGADVTFVAPTPGQSVQAAIVYQEGTDPSDSYLLLYLDTGIGLPATMNGADFSVRWDNGPNKIFRWL